MIVRVATTAINADTMNAVGYADYAANASPNLGLGLDFIAAQLAEGSACRRYSVADSRIRKTS
jgi:hypothetical protein